MQHLLGLKIIRCRIITILCIQVTRNGRSSHQAPAAACILPFYFLIYFRSDCIILCDCLMLLVLSDNRFCSALKKDCPQVQSSSPYTCPGGLPSLIWNELLLITIGVGVALIMNLYMPSVDKKLKRYSEQIEANFAKIFEEIEQYLMTGKQDWTGKEIPETHQLIKEAKALAYRDVENHVLRHENLYYHYFNMRQKQFEIIERVLPKITSISITTEHGQMIAEYVRDLREHIHPGNTAHKFLRRLIDMKEEFDKLPLPQTREEELRQELHFSFPRKNEQY
ncbi:aromatic acid exporter family protein [Bacillus pumilus]|nr:aromatic acid exporter family protein [Bacillus pumilus]